MWLNPKLSGPERLAYERTATPPEPTGQILARFPRKGEGGVEQELRIVRDEYQGHPFVSVRLWQRDQAGGWWPVKGKGVSIRLSEVDGVAAALAGLDVPATPPTAPPRTGSPRKTKGRAGSSPAARAAVVPFEPVATTEGDEPIWY